MKDYSLNTDGSPGAGDIIRGSQWPAGGETLPLTLIRSSGWTSGEDGWTWKLQISRTQRGASPDLELTASTAIIVGTRLTLTFAATDVETAALPDGPPTMFVELESEDLSNDISYWDEAAGFIPVRDPVGEG